MFKTIKYKFIFSTITLILIGVGIPSIFLINQFKENFEQRSKLMIKSTLDVVLQGMYDKMMSSDKKDVQNIIYEISQNESVDNIRVFNETGKILFASNADEIGKSMNEIAAHHMEDINLSDINISRLTDQGVYSVIEPINNKPQCQQCHGEGQILAYLDIDTNLTQAENYFHTGSVHFIFLAIIIIIVLFIIFYAVFNHLINKPLIRFNEAMDKVEKGEPDARLPAKKEDEIGTLEKHFNRMVNKLQLSQNKIEELHFEQLRHADKLVTLGELAAEMAHEINNPAAIIMSRADYLQMESENNSPLTNYKEDLGVIVNQIERVSKITQNILKYSKKLPKNFDKIELIQIINESTNILEPRLKKHKIKLIKDFKFDKVYIFGDAVQIEQVITNLVNNGIDAIGENGEMNIQVLKTEKQQVQIIISDTGRGIEKHIRDNIFSPFFTTKKRNKGTGLGLYIVKNICKNHNAEIECDSEPGKGTKFTITFKGVRSL
ncbi:MAG: HAMP domain-containing histidine kinase [Calditrichia bacterium]|nr:HAMP domain-containing histidine kinase [Calditrichia bacterium]